MATNDMIDRSVILLSTEMGVGKTRSALRTIKERLNTQPDMLRRPAPGRKLQAAYFFTPTLELGDEIASRAREIGLQPFVLRGRGAKNPDTDDPADRMCAKAHLLKVSETARDDGKSALCGTEPNLCSQRVGPESCPYIDQVEELLRIEANLVILTHASLWSTPPGDASLPDPIMIVIDEEPVLNSGLVTSRRWFGKSLSIKLSADDLETVAKLVLSRVSTAADEEAECIAGRLVATTGLPGILTRWQEGLDFKKRGEPYPAGESAGALLRMHKLRRKAVGARNSVASLQNMAVWLRAQTEPGTIKRNDFAAWRVNVNSTLGYLKEAIRPVLSPEIWVATPELQDSADKAHLLRQVIDLAENRIVPFLMQDGLDDDAPAPGLDVEIEFGRIDGQRGAVKVPMLSFAWLRPLLSRWRGVPTLLLDGTPDPRFYRLVWPSVRASNRITSRWRGRLFWVADKGFGKQALVASGSSVGGVSSGQRKNQLTARGKCVESLVTFVARFADGGVSCVTHMATEKLIGARGVAHLHHHGGVRGLDNMNGVAAHIVIGRQTPPVRLSERAVEALESRPVERIKVDSGRRTPNWFKEDAICAGIRSTIPSHPDEGVRAYRDQVSGAGLWQAVHRARPIRNRVDVFVLGSELDGIGDPSAMSAVEWDEINPTAIDRMLAEKGVAFGGDLAREAFPWLTRDQASRIGGMIDEVTWLQRWAIEKGAVRLALRVRPGPASVAGERRRSRNAVLLLRPGEVEEEVLAAVGLAPEPGTAP